MNPHETFLELAAVGIDFPLSPADRHRLDEHVTTCAACRHTADGLRADAEAFAELPPVRLGDRRADEIIDAVLHPGAVRQPLRLVAVVALLGLLLLGSLVVGAEVLRRLDEHAVVVPPVVTPAPTTAVAPTPAPTAPMAIARSLTGRLAVTRGDEGAAWVEGHTWVEIVTLDTGATSPLGFGADPAWGPNGLLVYACAKEVGENTTLCTLDADQAGTQPEIASDATRPAPAPDGTRVAFHRGAIDAGETWLVQADGSNLRRLAAGSFLDWSPDGEWLVGQPESVAYVVAIVRADGTGLQELVPGYGPTWSPSGTQIAYSFVENDVASVRVLNMTSDGSRRQGLIEVRYRAPAGVELSGPAWLADGGLVFVEAGDLWRLPADADVPIRITTDLGLDTSGARLSVSPDGRWVAFTRGSGADARVGVASVDGEVRLLEIGAGSSSQPVWAPLPAGQAYVGDTWEPATVTLPPDRPVGQVEAVTAGGPGFVAVGRGCVVAGESGTCEGVVWTSVDGRAWDRAPASDALDTGFSTPMSGPEVGMYDVATGQAGIVAIGYAARPQMQSTAWFSPEDPARWQRIVLGSSDTIRVHAVAWSGERFVIVGEARPRMQGASDIATVSARAGVWTTVDGSSWTQVPHQEALDVGRFINTMEDPAAGGMFDVVAGPGGLVAVGAVCPRTSATCQPAAWTSADGIAWERAADIPAVSGVLKAVAVSAGGLVAVGAEACDSSPAAIPGGCPALVLTSTDGRSWTQRPFQQAGDLRTITAIGGRFFATAPDGPVTLWTSPDGATWAAAEVEGGPATAGVEHVIAEWHLAATLGAAVWLGTPPGTDVPAAWVSVPSAR